MPVIDHNLSLDDNLNILTNKQQSAKNISREDTFLISRAKMAAKKQQDPAVAWALVKTIDGVLDGDVPARTLEQYLIKPPAPTSTNTKTYTGSKGPANIARLKALIKAKKQSFTEKNPREIEGKLATPEAKEGFIKDRDAIAQMFYVAETSQDESELEKINDSLYQLLNLTYVPMANAVLRGKKNDWRREEKVYDPKVNLTTAQLIKLSDYREKYEQMFDKPLDVQTAIRLVTDPRHPETRQLLAKLNPQQSQTSNKPEDIKTKLLSMPVQLLQQWITANAAKYEALSASDPKFAEQLYNKAYGDEALGMSDLQSDELADMESLSDKKLEEKRIQNFQNMLLESFEEPLDFGTATVSEWQPPESTQEEKIESSRYDTYKDVADKRKALVYDLQNGVLPENVIEELPLFLRTYAEKGPKIRKDPASGKFIIPTGGDDRMGKQYATKLMKFLVSGHSDFLASRGLEEVKDMVRKVGNEINSKLPNIGGSSPTRALISLMKNGTLDDSISYYTKIKHYDVFGNSWINSVFKPALFDYLKQIRQEDRELTPLGNKSI